MKGGRYMRGKKVFLLAAAVLLLASGLALCETGQPEIRRNVLPGLSENSYAAWPSLSWPDGRESGTLANINLSVFDGSAMTAYLSVLMQPGGSAGFQADYDAVVTDRYYIVRQTAQGKMPQGRPAQHNYPFLFNWRTGERLTLESVFSRPDEALSCLEEYIRQEISGSLSDYLENAKLIPLPGQRFLISHDTILFDYEPEDYTLLSGCAGSLSFTLEELGRITGQKDLLADFQSMPFEPDGDTGKRIRADVENSCFPGLYMSVSQPMKIGIPLTETATEFEETQHFDRTAFPGGWAVQNENAFLRDIWLLTGENADEVTGVLAKRGNLYGLVIGMNGMQEVRQALGEPKACLEITGEAAGSWLIEPGSMDVYEIRDLSGGLTTLSFSYSENGTLTSVLLRQSEGQEETAIQ